MRQPSAPYNGSAFISLFVGVDDLLGSQTPPTVPTKTSFSVCFYFHEESISEKKGIVKSFYCEQSSFDSVLSVERYSAVVIRYWTREVVFVDGAAG